MIAQMFIESHWVIQTFQLLEVKTIIGQEFRNLLAFQLI